VGIIVSLVGLTGCETNSATGKSQISALSRDQEVAMGIEGKAQMLQEMGGEVANADLRAYVTEIGQKLAAQTEGSNPSLPWEFTLLDSDVINAFALPGGKVFVSQGLAAKMTNEAQLAAVLGHEVGHVTARHINDKIARQTGTQIGLGLVGAVLGQGTETLQQLGAQAASVALLSYDRGEESEADSLGVRYMTRLKYDPQGMVQLMQILKNEGGGQTPEWQSTHPLPQTRIDALTAELRQDYAYTQNNPEYSLKPTEFQNRFLRKLGAGATPPSAGVFAYARGNHAGWCALCREAK
jgi:predicted Zn-dependent protease